jgi:putative hydrolase of the HAD superfamily
MSTQFDAIFYDLGGTLRLVERDAAFERTARQRIAELCGETGDPDAFCKFLDYRYEGYRKWCFETMREAPESELWTKWLTPEYPRDLILKNCVELTVEFRNKDGRRVVAENGVQSIRDLYENGYKLGIISNLVTSIEIPDWLREDNLEQYFDVVLLSCVEGIRKPDPEIYKRASDLLAVAPERCVYIGDNLKRDVEGARLAGFGMFILYTTPEKLEKLKKEVIIDENRPDGIIFDFSELKELFPRAPEINLDRLRTV